ncbi:MAG: RnfH family protein [Pseudomonadota bacterium]
MAEPFNFHLIQIEIVYALPERCTRIVINVPDGSTVQIALERSNFFSQYPELSLETIAVGIFGHPVALSYNLHDQDRIEIYRPLTMDPKTRRRLRHEAKGSLK